MQDKHLRPTEVENLTTILPTKVENSLILSKSTMLIIFLSSTRVRLCLLHCHIPNTKNGAWHTGGAQ